MLFFCWQHLPAGQVTGAVLENEDTSKATEHTVSARTKRSDFLIGINNKFTGITKIIIKSYNVRLFLLNL